MSGLQEPFLQLAMVLYMVALVGYLLRVAGSARGGKVAAAAGLVGLGLHTGMLVLRGLHAGHVPLVSMYEYLVAFAWMIVLAYLVFDWRYASRAEGMQAAGGLAMLAAVALLGYASTLPLELKQPESLMPVLKSNWLVFHVSVAIVGYAAATLATALAVLYFLRCRLTGPHSAWLRDRLPTPKALDEAIYRCARFAFPFLTLVNVTGAVWAYNAWGRYWGWDPKETWSLITWIVFTFYLHARLRAGWRPSQVNAVILVGLATILFTFLGVNQLAAFSDSLHSYAAGG